MDGKVNNAGVVKRYVVTGIKSKTIFGNMIENRKEVGWRGFDVNRALVRSFRWDRTISITKIGLFEEI
jgi:hypothetical protein